MRWSREAPRQTSGRSSSKQKSLFGPKHEVWSEMTWGRGLSESIDAAERGYAQARRKAGASSLCDLFSWSGNDVVGRNSYIDNPAALAGWATNTKAKRKAAMDIIEWNARARDFEAYGLTESYKVQMDGHARVLGHGSITVLNPQTLISNTSRSDRIHTDDRRQRVEPEALHSTLRCCGKAGGGTRHVPIYGAPGNCAKIPSTTRSGRRNCRRGAGLLHWSQRGRRFLRKRTRPTLSTPTPQRKNRERSG